MTIYDWVPDADQKVSSGIATSRDSHPIALNIGLTWATMVTIEPVNDYRCTITCVPSSTISNSSSTS
jgi:hypothetical protein